MINCNGAKTGTFDPFDDLYRIVYRLTMRTVGATEISESPELLDRTLKLFEDVESSASATRIAFPWLPTRGYIMQMVSGAKLYAIFDKFAKQRKATGKKYDDAFQSLLDMEVDMVRVLSVSEQKPPHVLLLAMANQTHELQATTGFKILTQATSGIHYEKI